MYRRPSTWDMRVERAESDNIRIKWVGKAN